MEVEAPLHGAQPTPGGQPQRASDVLVPRVLALFASPSEDVRALAVGVLNQLSAVMPAALLDALDRCENGLSGISSSALCSVAVNWPLKRSERWVCATLLLQLCAGTLLACA